MMSPSTVARERYSPTPNELISQLRSARRKFKRSAAAYAVVALQAVVVVSPASMTACWPPAGVELMPAHPEGIPVLPVHDKTTPLGGASAGAWRGRPVG